MAEIHHAVGQVSSHEHGANSPADVMLVQKLLIKHKLLPETAATGNCDAQTIAAIRTFQKGFMKDPDGRVDPHGTTLKHLEDGKGTKGKTFKIVRGKNFSTGENAVQLDPELLRRVTALCQYLIDNDLVTGDIVFTQGVRSRETAHKWSTSWNIRKRKVSLARLQALKNGQDKDGKLWYDKAWEEGLERDKSGYLTKAAQTALWKKIDQNARAFYDSNAVAAEGYKTTDERIKPNVHPKVSNHISGNAMDVSIPWKEKAKVGSLTISNGQNDDKVANHLVQKFGLSRPVQSEKWHFQLGTSDHFNYTNANNTGYLSGKDPYK